MGALSLVIRASEPPGPDRVKTHGLVVQKYKGHVKLIKRVKIALSFLQSVSDQFHIIILNLPM